jgi:lipopolysaccharide exporter
VSIALAAARGVAWNMLFGVGSRLLQLVGTLVLTRFLAPEAYGAVIGASIAVLTMGISTSFAFGQYLIAHRSTARVAFQAAVIHVALGIVTMAVVIVMRHRLADWFGAAQIATFIPGFAIAHILDRLRYVPERMLTRELKYRTIATINGSAEILFTVVALALVGHFGAEAIMFAAIVRAAFCTWMFIATAPRHEWLSVSKLDSSTVRSLFGYGTPIMLTTISDHAASRFDSMIVSSMFGPAIMACYNLAYSLAEMPVNSIAGNIAEVLMPSYSKMPDADRAPAVVKSAALMTLVVAPLGVGLGAVAPSLVSAFFNDKWALMAPMLIILSVMTVFRPMYWPAIAYLQAVKQTQLIMYLSVGRAVIIIGLVAGFGAMGGALWACLGAGIGYALHSLVTIIATGKSTGLPVRPYLIGVGRPLLLCIPMFATTMALGHLLNAAAAPPLVSLIAQVAVGAAVYVGAAFTFARPTSMLILKLARGAASKEGQTPQPKPE